MKKMRRSLSIGLLGLVGCSFSLSAAALTPKAAEDENSPVISVAKPPPRVKTESPKINGKSGKKHPALKRKKARAI